MNLFKFFCPVLLGALVSCAGRSDWWKDASNLIGEGRFSQLDSLLEEAEPGASEQELRAIDSLREVMRRLRIEFCYNEGQILSRIRQRVSDTVSPEQIRRWEKSGRLEMRRIDSRKRYFSRSVGNLILLAPELEGLRRIDSSEIGFRERHAARVIAATDSLGMCTNPVTMTIRYTLVVEPDAVPEGDTIRCWLPYPQEGLPRQTGVELISAWPERYVVAPKGTPQRSICFEQPARRDSATVFRLAFRVTTRAQYFDPEELSKRVEPYDTLSEVYRKYTAQRPPHLVFSERIERKARELAGGETDPVRIVSRIYDWIDDIPWAGAIEYGVIPNIPEYVLDAGHGDCGQVSLLLIAMLRSVGIPARWESGWMLHPGHVGLHDWGSVYYEGVGWVPLDISFGKLAASADPAVRDFYKTGMDSYRLVVNSDYGYPFDPPKRHMRSEPVDFQRGEAETSERNLYFDEWDYHMDVTYE